MTGSPDDASMADAEWDRVRRGENETQRLDRNWSDLLQELRVAQTGVQLLTGFLLTLPFQQRFGKLDLVSRSTYLATVGTAIAATAALVAPVSAHRLLFRRHARRSLVSIAHWCALAGLSLLGLATCGAAYVITALVISDVAGTVAAALVATVLTTAWVVMPIALREKSADH